MRNKGLQDIRKGKGELMAAAKKKEEALELEPIMSDEEIEDKAQHAPEAGTPMVFRSVTDELNRFEEKMDLKFVPIEQAEQAMNHISQRIDKIILFLNEQFKPAPEAKE